MKLMENIFFRDIYSRLGLNEFKSYQGGDLNIIPYHSVDEFLNMNPNCCEVKKLQDNHSCSDLTEIKSKYINSSCVYMDYLIRYKDEKGNIKQKSTKYFDGQNKTSVTISPKGEILEWNTYKFIG